MRLFRRSLEIQSEPGLFVRMCGYVAGLSTVYAFQSKHFRHKHTKREGEMGRDRQRGRERDVHSLSFALCASLSRTIQDYATCFKKEAGASSSRPYAYLLICVFVYLPVLCVCVCVCLHAANIFIDNWQM